MDLKLYTKNKYIIQLKPYKLASEDVKSISDTINIWNYCTNNKEAIIIFKKTTSLILSNTLTDYNSLLDMNMNCWLNIIMLSTNAKSFLEVSQFLGYETTIICTLKSVSESKFIWTITFNNILIDDEICTNNIDPPNDTIIHQLVSEFLYKKNFLTSPHIFNSAVIGISIALFECLPINQFIFNPATILSTILDNKWWEGNKNLFTQLKIELIDQISEYLNNEATKTLQSLINQDYKFNQDIVLYESYTLINILKLIEIDYDSTLIASKIINLLFITENCSNFPSILTNYSRIINNEKDKYGDSFLLNHTYYEDNFINLSWFSCNKYYKERIVAKNLIRLYYKRMKRRQKLVLGRLSLMVLLHHPCVDNYISTIIYSYLKISIMTE